MELFEKERIEMLTKLEQDRLMFNSQRKQEEHNFTERQSKLLSAEAAWVIREEEIRKSHESLTKSIDSKEKLLSERTEQADVLQNKIFQLQVFF